MIVVDDDDRMSAKRIPTKTPGIYKRGSRFQFVYRDSHGKQHWESAENKMEAKAKLAERSAGVSRVPPTGRSRMSDLDYSTGVLIASIGLIGQDERECQFGQSSRGEGESSCLAAAHYVVGVGVKDDDDAEPQTLWLTFCAPHAKHFLSKTIDRYDSLGDYLLDEIT